MQTEITTDLSFSFSSSRAQNKLFVPTNKPFARGEWLFVHATNSLIAKTTVAWEQKLSYSRCRKDVSDTAVFKWLSPVIARLLRLVIGLRICAGFSTNEKQTKTNLSQYARFFWKLLEITWNSDLSIALFAPVVIGCSNNFDIGFSKGIWKPLSTILTNPIRPCLRRWRRLQPAYYRDGAQSREMEPNPVRAELICTVTGMNRRFFY